MVVATNNSGGPQVNHMDGRAILRMDIGVMVWALPKSLYRIHALWAYPNMMTGAHVCFQL